MNTTITGVVGDERYDLIFRAFMNGSPFQFPGGTTWYHVAHLSTFALSEKEVHYEAEIAVINK